MLCYILFVGINNGSRQLTFVIRIAKVTPSPFNEGDEMKLYHHPACMFETFKRARATTKARLRHCQSLLQ